MWSVGCIFGELINKEPMFPGKNEADEIGKMRETALASFSIFAILTSPLFPLFQIFKLLGQPTEASWPGFSNLPHARSISKVAQP